VTTSAPYRSSWVVGLVCVYAFAADAFAVSLVVAQASAPPVTSSPARAAGPGTLVSAEPPGYREAVDAAIAEYEGGNFAESRALFARAHALFPNARSLRGLGMADFELRNYASSIDYLQQALASPVKALEGELRAETEQLLARARGFVGRFRLSLQPADAAVTLDGSGVPPGATAQLVLAVGDHTLEVSAVSRVSERRVLRVTGGEDATLEFNLPEQAAITPQAVTSSEPSTQSSSSLLASPWLWAAVGVVVVGAAVGIGLAASSGGTHTAGIDTGTSGVSLRGPQ
jgi:hypothetical protein